VQSTPRHRLFRRDAFLSDILSVNSDQLERRSHLASLVLTADDFAI
jgi:hypothetical protein